ncbi:unnamed protein product [Cylindrotheca closterium]|uniref:Fungal lipase-type domain-containing protein n=1 Tax=Cylindrotheca closterium TaxID=2856 RepID=A0AAD2G3H8_9STRA|nr:unnamed protein product [Cylindrotheca closterium]
MKTQKQSQPRMKQSQFQTILIGLLICSSIVLLTVEASILFVIQDSEEQKAEKDQNFFQKLFRRQKKTGSNPQRHLGSTQGSKDIPPEQEILDQSDESESIKNDTISGLIDELGEKAASFLKEKVFGQTSVQELEKAPGFLTLFSGNNDGATTGRKDENWYKNLFVDLFPPDGNQDKAGNTEKKDKISGPMKALNNFRDRGKNNFVVQELLQKTTLLEQNAVTSSIPEVLGLLKEAVDNAINQMTKTFEKVLSSVGPTTTIALIYYIANQEESYTPSWKRQQHRFYAKITPQVAIELHDALYLSQLAYVNSISEFRAGLHDFQHGTWELAYGSTESLPAKPANFLLVHKNPAPLHDAYFESVLPWESKKGNELQVALVVRGTKNLPDILADMTLDLEDYRGGKAHGGILISGRALVDFYAPKLKELLKHSGRDVIRLYIVGHSLGAGAGAIAAMEFKEYDFVEVEAVGFGCPALLSPELSETTKDYITTVVADADVVPRMSGASMVNAILDLIGFNWTTMAREDFKFTMDRIEETTPVANIKPILPPKSHVLKWSEEILNYTATEKFDRVPISLIPPGNCIHLFRDGVGYTGSVTPCSYFANGVEISRTMVDDHLVMPGYHRALVTMMRDWNQDFNVSMMNTQLLSWHDSNYGPLLSQSLTSPTRSQKFRASTGCHTMSEVFDTLFAYLCGTSAYHAEIRTFGMALQGAIAVRKGPNKDGKMHFFHAFAMTTIAAFAGGWFTGLWMGKPTSMIASGDVNVTLAMIAFIIVNYTPFDIGYKIMTSLPATLVITSMAQMFRSMGTIGFISVAANELKPSKYYPTAIIGPILYGALLGNMGGFFKSGVEGYLANGIPWPFQNAFFIGTWFHLFVHDVEGPIGSTLRETVYTFVDPRTLGLPDMDNRAFGILVMNVFMQVTGIIMLPIFLGPAFSPIAAPMIWIVDFVKSTAGEEPTVTGKSLSPPAAAEVAMEKRKKRKKKKKKA